MTDTKPDDRRPATDDTTEQSADRLFRSLANGRRRQILSYLVVHQSLTVADLADEIAVLEFEAPLPEIDGDAVVHIYASLIHTHIPELADASFVEYDDDREIVALAENDRVTQVKSFLELLELPRGGYR